MSQAGYGKGQRQTASIQGHSVRPGGCKAYSEQKYSKEVGKQQREVRSCFSPGGALARILRATSQSLVACKNPTCASAAGKALR